MFQRVRRKCNYIYILGNFVKPLSFDIFFLKKVQQNRKKDVVVNVMDVLTLPCEIQHMSTYHNHETPNFTLQKVGCFLRINIPASACQKSLK